MCGLVSLNCRDATQGRTLLPPFSTDQLPPSLIAQSQNEEGTQSRRKRAKKKALTLTSLETEGEASPNPQIACEQNAQQTGEHFANSEEVRVCCD